MLRCRVSGVGQAKLVLDAGADGIIVLLVNSAECARRAVSIASFPPCGERVQRRMDEGYRFIACSLDTELLIHGCRKMLGKENDR